MAAEQVSRPPVALWGVVSVEVEAAGEDRSLAGSIGKVTFTTKEVARCQAETELVLVDSDP